MEGDSSLLANAPIMNSSYRVKNTCCSANGIFAKIGRPALTYISSNVFKCGWEVVACICSHLEEVGTYICTYVRLYIFKTFNLLKTSASIYKMETMDIRQY